MPREWTSDVRGERGTLRVLVLLAGLERLRRPEHAVDELKCHVADSATLRSTEFVHTPARERESASICRRRKANVAQLVV